MQNEEENGEMLVQAERKRLYWGIGDKCEQEDQEETEESLGQLSKVQDRVRLADQRLQTELCDREILDYFEL